MFNAVGGSTIMYAAHFLRFHPSDFRVKTLDGIADDWPLDSATATEESEGRAPCINAGHPEDVGHALRCQITIQDLRTARSSHGRSLVRAAAYQSRGVQRKREGRGARVRLRDGRGPQSGRSSSRSAAMSAICQAMTVVTSQCPFADALAVLPGTDT
jgi:choline dehydrogenase-like flavoprotein